MPNISWLDYQEVFRLLVGGWNDFVRTNFGAVSYSDVRFAIQLAGLLAVLSLFRLILNWFGRKPARPDSGHLISESSRGFFRSLVTGFPKLLLVASLASILAAIAGPFFLNFKEGAEYIEARTIVKIKDVSGSMSSFYRGSDKRKARIAMEADLEFTKMRRGGGDRVSLWIFSNNPYMIHDFTNDEKLIYFASYDSPWEIGGGVYPPDSELWKEYEGYPPLRYVSIAGEGGTVFSPALRAVIRQFDEDEKQQKLSPYFKGTGERAIIVLTDAAISDIDDVRKDVVELSKRRIRLFIIFVDDNGEITNVGAGVQELLNEVVRAGGKYFPISSESALRQAYQEINRIQKIIVRQTVVTYRTPIHDKFIFFSLLTLIMIIPAGVIIDVFFYTYP